MGEVLNVRRDGVDLLVAKTLAVEVFIHEVRGPGADDSH